MKRVHMTEQEAHKYITELFKIVDTNSVLVVISTGQKNRLYCPFCVIYNIDALTLQMRNEFLLSLLK